MIMVIAAVVVMRALGIALAGATWHISVATPHSARSATHDATVWSAIAPNLDGQTSPFPLIVADLRPGNWLRVRQIVDHLPIVLARLDPVELVSRKREDRIRIVRAETVLDDTQTTIASIAIVPAIIAIIGVLLWGEAFQIVKSCLLRTVHCHTTSVMVRARPASIDSDTVLENNTFRVKVASPYREDVVTCVLNVSVVYERILHKTMEIDSVSMEKHGNEVLHAHIACGLAKVSRLSGPHSKLACASRVVREVVEPHVFDQHI